MKILNKFYLLITKCVFLTILFILIVSNIYSQTYETINSPVYDFLNRISLKLDDNFDLTSLPLSRIKIYERLQDISKNINKLTDLEQDELRFYSKNYFLESRISKNEDNVYSKIFPNNDSVGLSSYIYSDRMFGLQADPIFGLKIGSLRNNSYTHRWNGLKIFGYLNKNIGFYFYFKDNLETGSSIDRNKSLVNETGIKIIKADANSIQYDEVQAALSYSWEWGNISIQKEYINWGSGFNGKLFLSNKAPAFPMFKLELEPNEWFKFVYFHGWLKSEIIDSHSIRHNAVKSLDSYTDVSKYIAAHMITVRPFSTLNITLGESIIYSDRIEPIYFIPFLFFRLADHYMMSDGYSGGNCQLFANVDYLIPPLKAKIYSTVYIDELSIEELFKGNKLSAIGLTVGCYAANPLIKNSDFYIEYTRINPFVYMNSNDAQHFKNSYYQLGHWIGSNADLLTFNYSQSIIRGLRFQIQVEFLRKGGKELPDEQYALPYPTFLYGKVYKQNKFSLLVNYEWFNNINISGYYEFSSISDEDKTRTPDYELGSKTSFGLSVSYGL